MKKTIQKSHRWFTGRLHLELRNVCTAPWICLWICYLNILCFKKGTSKVDLEKLRAIYVEILQDTTVLVCCHYTHQSSVLADRCKSKSFGDMFQSSSSGRTKVKCQCAAGMTLVARACSFRFTGATFTLYSGLSWFSEGSAFCSTCITSIFSYSRIEFKKKKYCWSSPSLDALAKIFCLLLIHREQRD